MDIAQSFSLLPGDPSLIDHIVCELKSQGKFDQFRKECIADVDTKPAYQNLRQRVEGSVAGFLSNQKWKPELNKNQLREKLRKHILDSNFLDQGVERIVDQAVNPKIVPVFHPQVEEVVYKCFGVRKPERSDHYVVNGDTESKLELKISTDDLLPCDLEAVSPDSVKSHEKFVGTSFQDIQLPPDVEMVEKKEETEVKVERIFPSVDTEDSDDSKDDDFESPAFEPLDDDLIKRSTSPNHSQMSGLSDMHSRDSNDSNSNAKTSLKQKKTGEKILESQMSQASTDSDISIKVSKMGKKSLIYDSTYSGDEANISSAINKDSPAITAAKFNFSNDDNSSDARQCFEQSEVKAEPMECDDNSADESSGKGETKDKTGIVKSSSSSETAEPINRHRSSIESKTSSDENKPIPNLDVSMDSNESKSSSIFTSVKHETYEVKDTFTFTNKISAMDDHSIDGEDSSSNGLKIDLQETAQYSEENITSINRLSISGSDDVSTNIKSPNDDVKSKDSPSSKHRDSHSDGLKSRSKDERRSSSSHHSKDHKDRHDDKHHHSKSSHSKHRDSISHHDRKYSSSSSYDRKEGHSKSSKESSDKDKYGRSSNGESRKDSGDRHKSSHSSKHHSSSKRHDDSHRSRHSTSDRSDKSDRHSSRHDSHRSDRDKDSSKHSEPSRDKSSAKHGDKNSDHSSSTDRSKSSQRDKSSSKHSSSDKRRKSSSDKKDEKKSKDKSEKDDHYSSSGRGGRTRRSTDRDSNDGNNGSNKSSSYNSAESSNTANQSSTKEKSGGSNKDNCSNGNYSSGQSDKAVKDKLNISVGGYIKSEFNMFQPVVKKPPTPLMNLHRSPDAVIKKPVIHIDSQLNPVKIEEPKVEEPPQEEVPKIRKPRFASNIFEARKLMKVRKNMDKMELKRKQDAQELLEKQNNTSKSESKIFSGVSGPELRISCHKVDTDVLKKSPKPKKQRDSDHEQDLFYFDEDSKQRSLIELEKMKKVFKKFLATINGVEQKHESVLHLIGCDKSLEQAFVRLSRKNNTIRTVNTKVGACHQNSKVSPHKLEIPVDSEIILPSSSECYVDLIDMKLNAQNDLLTSKRLPLKKRKLPGRKVVRNIEIKPDVVVEIKPNTIEEKIMPNHIVSGPEDHCLSTMDMSNEYGDEYFSSIDDMLSRATKQDIMEIILGGDMNFDASNVDLKLVKNEIDIGDLKVETPNGKSANRKRKISFQIDEKMDVPTINNNNHFKGQIEATIPKRQYMESVSSTEESGVGLVSANRLPVEAILKGEKLGKARRVGLPKIKKTGISRSKLNVSFNIPSSPESDKSVENHINQSVRFTVQNYKENSDDIGSTALNHSNHQMTKRKRNFKDNISIKNCINEKIFEPNMLSMEQAQ